MKKYLICFLLCLSQFQRPGRAAQTFSRKTDSKVTDLARDFFGDPASLPRSPGIDFGHVHADVSTKMDCGRIDLVTDFEAQFRKIREQAHAFVKNIDGYVAAAPMMATCYMMPQVCALLRHDHFQFAQNLNLRAQACAALDRYVDNQAEKGAKQLEAESRRSCVEASLSKGMDMASATADCQSKTGMPLRDLSHGLRKAYTSKPQRVLAALLSHVREPSSYEFLSSLLGEIEIQADGYWQAVWPQKMQRPDAAARNIIGQAIDAVCAYSASGRRADSPSESIHQVPELARNLSVHLTQETQSELADLSDGDRRLACHALGRSLGTLAARQSASRHEAVLASALTSGALPEGLKQEYRHRASSAFSAFRESLQSDEVKPLDEVKRSIREVARLMRRANRNAAAGISRARLENENANAAESDDCTDTASCNWEETRP